MDSKTGNLLMFTKILELMSKNLTSDLIHLILYTRDPEVLRLKDSAFRYSARL